MGYRNRIGPRDEFTRDRDIWVHWKLVNWVLGDRYQQPIANSTGEAAELKVRLIDSDGNRYRTAHINACVLMMAEKASDMIRGKPALAAAA